LTELPALEPPSLARRVVLLSASPAVEIPVGDRQAAIPPESLRRDLHTGRRLAALVLRAVDHRDDAVHERSVEALGDELLRRAVLFHVALDDRIELLVRRQAVGVLL